MDLDDLKGEPEEGIEYIVFIAIMIFGIICMIFV